MKGDPRIVTQANTKYGENCLMKIILLFTKYCWRDQMEDDITLACSTRYLMATAYKVLVSKSEKEKPLGEAKRK
jgi:hypothetical protein